ncbi:LacI family DNA-binding transcriptional regulator [Pseudactinotalea terrae]|uniref:LacI family DNA-binding transcriptional regulator n=1 Tax=Pseudactinotalea terrae TaxID=1743262 RepID=UPI0012E26F09|nr:LacI family DNA-binding transcriptional regulator [Pseudactinotalea terrae]
MSDTQTTLAAIAAEAGVSQPTVSKVLNGRPDVAPATRERVEQLLLRAGYVRRRRPSTGAETPRILGIDLALPLIVGPWATEIVRGVETAARGHGAVVSLFELGEHNEHADSWLESAITRSPAAALLVFTTLSPQRQRRLRARGIPCVLIDPAADEIEELPSVGSSNFQGGRTAARHLIDLGHERIGVIGGPTEQLACRARVAGFKDVMGTSGVPIDPTLFGSAPMSVEGGYEQALRLLSLEPRPSAIFASSDLQALGVYRAAVSLGLAIPGDLSVVGYDGLPVCDWVSPELTSVAQPLAEMTAQAVDLALDLASGKRSNHTHVDLTVRLQVRRSTSPPGPSS